VDADLVSYFSREGKEGNTGRRVFILLSLFGILDDETAEVAHLEGC
jgi:hypothetical protein